LYIRRLLLSEQAKKDTLPGFIPTPLRGAFSPMTSMGASYLARKYAIATDLNRHETELVRILGDVDKALGGRRHLLGDDFTFADITMAVVLQLVAPVANEYLVLSPALRSVSTEPSLAARFSGLVEWRDALYAAHRKTR
jgi:glutathione S-transferase